MQNVPGFKNFAALQSTIYIFLLKWKIKWRIFWSSEFFEAQKYYFVFDSRLNFFFSNGHIHNFVSTLPNVVKIYAENGNVVSTLSNVVQINVEIGNVDSTLFKVVNFKVDVHNVASRLIWRCATSQRHINLQTTLKCLLSQNTTSNTSKPLNSNSNTDDAKARKSKCVK